VAAALSVVGSLAGLPTITVPATHLDGVPVGLSFLALPGQDGRLFSFLAGC
jgi:Asp-tRNA(Asn)/Glu-tRNA(Gln) amidotransferase A subunit family amidase